MSNYTDIRALNNFNHNFATITEPRQKNKVKHLLTEILFMAVMAIIAGAESFEDIHCYAKKKLPWLLTFLKLPNGIPSHDTFNRVFCMIDPVEFENNFVSWVNDYKDLIASVADEDEVIPIDGKTVRKSVNKNKGTKAIHMVSALSTKYGLILGQQKCEEKSNEITAIPLLLTMISINGTIVTIDAMGCQKSIASQIIKSKANYILALKENQENLYNEVVDFFNKVEKDEFKHYIYSQDIEVDKGHGRIEERSCITVTNLSWLLEPQKWEGIQCIAKITAKVIKNDKETTENRYYISSLNGTAKQINRAVRKHWHIENKLHWVLDVTFNEDDCRVRTGYGAENLTIVRKIALNKLRVNKTSKRSIAGKRKDAAWDDNFAAAIFNEMMNK